MSGLAHARDRRTRLFIDVGTNLPAEATFAPGFTRTPFGARYAGKEDKAAASASRFASIVPASHHTCR